MTTDIFATSFYQVMQVDEEDVSVPVVPLGKRGGKTNFTYDEVGIQLTFATFKKKW